MCRNGERKTDFLKINTTQFGEKNLQTFKAKLTQKQSKILKTAIFSAKKLSEFE